MLAACLTQGSGRWPLPWSWFCRPVGPGACAPGHRPKHSPGTCFGTCFGSAPPLPQKRSKLAGQIRRQPIFLAGAMEKDQDRRGFAVDLPGFESGQQDGAEQVPHLRKKRLRLLEAAGRTQGADQVVPRDGIKPGIAARIDPLQRIPEQLDRSFQVVRRASARTASARARRPSTHCGS